MAAVIRFDQAALPAGVDNRSRSDIVAGTAVTITNVSPGIANVCELLGKPTDDDTAVITGTSPTWSITPKSGTFGTYRIRLTVDSDVVIHTFTVRTPFRSLAIGVGNEGANPYANLVDTDPGTWVNESETNEGGHFWGWWPGYEELAKAIDRSIPLIPDLISESSLAAGDEIVIYDLSATGHRRVSLSDFSSFVSGIGGTIDDVLIAPPVYYWQLAFSNGHDIIQGDNSYQAWYSSSNNQRGLQIGLDTAYRFFLSTSGPSECTIGLYPPNVGTEGILIIKNTATLNQIITYNANLSLFGGGGARVLVNGVDLLDSGSGTNFLSDDGSYKSVSGSKLSTQNKEMTASLTTSDGDQACATSIQVTPAGDGFVRVLVNGLAVVLGNGVKTKTAYFSGDGGTTARAIADIQSGDFLYWNGSIAKFELASTDIIDFDYAESA